MLLAIRNQTPRIDYKPRKQMIIDTSKLHHMYNVRCLRRCCGVVSAYSLLYIQIVHHRVLWPKTGLTSSFFTATLLDLWNLTFAVFCVGFLLIMAFVDCDEEATKQACHWLSASLFASRLVVNGYQRQERAHSVLFTIALRGQIQLIAQRTTGCFWKATSLQFHAEICKLANQQQMKNTFSVNLLQGQLTFHMNGNGGAVTTLAKPNSNGDKKQHRYC